MTHRFAVLVILFTSFLVGGIWAAVLPPWDLNDEQQHMDYVQKISVTGSLPILGDSRLSPGITESIAATDRWTHLHLKRPSSMDPSTWGLEGQSYQSYQPPLYYLVLVAPFRLMPADSLFTMYGLRLITVFLAALSALVLYLVLVEITNGRRDLSLLGSIALILVPERAQATSRVNNDVMTELFGTLALLLIVWQWKSGLTWRRSFAIGLVVGLALLSKSSAVVLVVLMVFAFLKPSTDGPFRYRMHHLATQLLVVVVVSGWQIGRNVVLYGDPTGSAAFLRLAGFQPTLRMPDALMTLGQGMWITRWHGQFPLIISIAIWTLLIFHLFGLVGLTRQRPYIFLLIAATLLWLVPLIYGASTGLIQTIEGRFVLAGLSPLIGLGALGACQLRDLLRSRMLTGGLVATVAIGNAATLIFFSLPYYYGISLMTR